jgi:hypothetical protein
MKHRRKLPEPHRLIGQEGLAVGKIRIPYAGRPLREHSDGVEIKGGIGWHTFRHGYRS